MKKKPIAFFIPNIYPNSIGGLEIFYYHLIKSIDANYEVITITSNCNTSLPNCIKINNRIFAIRRFGLGKFSSFISLIFINIRFKPSLFHIPYTSNFGSYSLYFYILKLIFHFKIVLVNHGGGLKKWKNPFLQRMFLRNSERIIAVSKEIKMEYEKRTARKDIEIIYPLVPFKKITEPKNEIKNTWGISQESNVILMVGSIKPLKGPDILLDAFLSLGEEYINKNHLVLVYAGDGVMKRELENRVQKSNIQDSIYFFGNVAFEKIGEIYCLSDIYVIASWFEGLPKSLLGAMAYEIPIIGSNSPGINDLVIDQVTGILFEKKSSEDLARKLKYYIINHHKRREFASRMNEFYMKEYSYDKTVNRFCEVYNELL